MFETVFVILKFSQFIPNSSISMAERRARGDVRGASPHAGGGEVRRYRRLYRIGGYGASASRVPARYRLGGTNG